MPLRYCPIRDHYGLGDLAAMIIFLRAFFWILIVITCAAAVFCGFQIERPIAMVWPVETVAVWGAVAALFSAIGLFFTMPQSRNGRIGLVVGSVLVAFSAYTSLQALERTKFLYRSVDLAVNIESPTGDIVTVGGVLVLPVNRYNLSVLLLMPDASPDSFARNLFYAKALARRGIAAVAYRRSDPKANGPNALAAVDLETRGDDVIYILDLLEKRTEINMRHAGVMGFGENEWVIPYTVQKTTRLYFAMLMAPSGMTPTERIVANLDQKLRAEGVSGDELESAKALVTELGQNLQTGDVGEKRAKLILRWEAAKQKEWFKSAALPEEVPQLGSLAPAATSLSFAPEPLWTMVEVPVLLVAGSADSMSLPETLRERFTKYFEKNEKATWDLQVVPNANHQMLLNTEDYSSLDAEIPQGFFDSLAAWIGKVTAPPEMTNSAGQDALPAHPAPTSAQ